MPHTSTTVGGPSTRKALSLQPGDILAVKKSSSLLLLVTQNRLSSTHRSPQSCSQLFVLQQQTIPLHTENNSRASPPLRSGFSKYHKYQRLHVLPIFTAAISLPRCSMLSRLRPAVGGRERLPSRTLHHHQFNIYFI